MRKILQLLLFEYEIWLDFQLIFVGFFNQEKTYHIDNLQNL